MLAPVNSARLRYLDWTRGLAALIMLQGHVFHSFTRTDLRGAGPYIFSQFLGGLPPPFFLFLPGFRWRSGWIATKGGGWGRAGAAYRDLPGAGSLLVLRFLFPLRCC